MLQTKDLFFTKITYEYEYDLGVFIDRPNRFIAHINYKSKILRCHVPDPGRLKYLLLPKSKVLLRFSPNQDTQKTDASVIGVFNKQSNIWVSLDSQLANRFIKHNWEDLPIFKNYNSIISEFKHQTSRLDFLLTNTNTNSNCLVEVKTATMVHNGIGKFPDAPTKRGTRHVHEITKAIINQEFDHGLVTFVVPRSDVNVVKPNKQLDPDFYNAVKIAMEKKVQFLVLKCDFTTNGLIFLKEIPFMLE